MPCMTWNCTYAVEGTLYMDLMSGLKHWLGSQAATRRHTKSWKTACSRLSNALKTKNNAQKCKSIDFHRWLGGLFKLFATTEKNRIIIWLKSTLPSERIDLNITKREKIQTKAKLVCVTVNASSCISDILSIVRLQTEIECISEIKAKCWFWKTSKLIIYNRMFAWHCSIFIAVPSETDQYCLQEIYVMKGDTNEP